MKKKKLVLILIVFILVVIGLIAWLNIANNDNESVQPVLKNEQRSSEDGVEKTGVSEHKGKHKHISKENKDIQDSNVEEKIKDKKVKETNLYGSAEDAMLPLSTISTMSELPQNIKAKVAKIAETSNIYMTKKSGNKLFIITDNPNNIRHSVEFVEISVSNGHQINTTLGYNDRMKDSDNDTWVYDEKTQAPVKHSKYNKNGDIDFVEEWNYGDNPVKYEMKDADGHVLSLRKETVDGDSGLRVEHLIYDKSGKTLVNVSATYDGSDVKRFTYYNADKPSEGGSVFAEYSDGQKTKETLYTNDLKVINTYTSNYKDGEREDIIIWDKNNKEVQKLVPEKSEEDL